MGEATSTRPGRLPCGCRSCAACAGTGRVVQPDAPIGLCTRCAGRRHEPPRPAVVRRVGGYWLVYLRGHPTVDVVALPSWDLALRLAVGVTDQLRAYR